MTNKLRFPAKKSGGFTLPPEGTFDLQIVEVDTSKTDKDGHPQVVVKFQIAQGKHEGMDFRQYYTLSEERGWAFRHLCEKAGMDLENLNEDEDDEMGDFVVDVDDLHERFIKARIEINEGSNKKKYVNLRDEEPSTLQQAAEGTDAEPADEPADEPDPPPARRRRAPPAAS